MNGTISTGAVSSKLENGSDHAHFVCRYECDPLVTSEFDISLFMNHICAPTLQPPPPPPNPTQREREREREDRGYSSSAAAAVCLNGRCRTHENKKYIEGIV